MKLSIIFTSILPSTNTTNILSFYNPDANFDETCHHTLLYFFKEEIQNFKNIKFKIS